jgi:hypothetical protein
MERLGLVFSILIGFIGSLGCCCPAVVRNRPIVIAPPPIVLPPPPELNPVAPQPANPPLAGARTFDLIPIVDLNWDVVDGKGKWRLENNKLLCTEGNFVPRVQIPYVPPAEYDFSVTFAQPGLRNGISLIMPKPGGGMFFWYLGINGGSGYGFAADPANKGGEIPGLVKVNAIHVTTVQVRQGGVKGYLDGKLLLDHRTDFRDLKSDNWREMKNQRLLGVACDDPATFHRIQIVEITGNGKASR